MPYNNVAHFCVCVCGVSRNMRDSRQRTCERANRIGFKCALTGFFFYSLLCLLLYRCADMLRAWTNSAPRGTLAKGHMLRGGPINCVCIMYIYTWISRDYDGMAGRNCASDIRAFGTCELATAPESNEIV